MAANQQAISIFLDFDGTITTLTGQASFNRVITWRGKNDHLDVKKFLELCEKDALGSHKNNPIKIKDLVRQEAVDLIRKQLKQENVTLYIVSLGFETVIKTLLTSKHLARPLTQEELEKITIYARDDLYKFKIEDNKKADYIDKSQFILQQDLAEKYCVLIDDDIRDKDKRAYKKSDYAENMLFVHVPVIHAELDWSQVTEAIQEKRTGEMTLQSLTQNNEETNHSGSSLSPRRNSR
jgi:2-hydroxy-3-keto-5-methylthiopentenyl-1-phosphate phosphatase